MKDVLFLKEIFDAFTFFNFDRNLKENYAHISTLSETMWEMIHSSAYFQYNLYIK